MAAAAKSSTPLIQKLFPLLNRVLIKKALPITQTKGGIVLPEEAQEEGLQKGTVVAVGPGVVSEKGELIPVSVKPGDEVILSDSSGIKIDLDTDGVYYLYKDTELLAKIKE